MTTPKTKKNTPVRTRTRAEVAQEFEKISTEEAKKESLTPAELAAQKEREVHLSVLVSSTTTEGVLKGALELKAEVSRSLDEINRSITQQLELARDLSEAIVSKRAEIEELHKIEVAANALQILLVEHGEKKAKLEEEISEARAAWAKEQIEYSRKIEEEARSLKQQRDREKDEYEYKKNTERRAQEDAHKLKMEKLQKDLQELETTTRTALAKLTADLEAERAAFEKTKTEFVASQDAVIKELRREFAIELNTVKRDANEKLKEATAKAEADQRLAELTKKNLEDQVAQRDAQISRLAEELVQSRKMIENISQRAIDGAAKTEALGQLTGILNRTSETGNSTRKA